MSLTVAELIEQLEKLPESVQDSEVRFAYQPHYPLFVTVGDIALSGSQDAASDEKIVYLTQDPWGDAGYAPETLFNGEDNEWDSDPNYVQPEGADGESDTCGCGHPECGAC